MNGSEIARSGRKTGARWAGIERTPKRSPGIQ
jgi:hypothetical protein